MKDDLSKLNSTEESFIEEFKSRICDVDYEPYFEIQIKKILPEVSKLSLHVDNRNLSAEKVSSIINENAHSLKHLYLSDIYLDGLFLTEDLPHLRTLSIDDCSDNVITDILKKIKGSKIHKLDIDNFEKYLSAANISSLISNNSDSLKDLILMQINKVEIPKSLQIVRLELVHCDTDVANEILINCADTLQHLTLTLVTYKNFNIPSLNNLKS